MNQSRKTKERLLNVEFINMDAEYYDEDTENILPVNKMDRDDPDDRDAENENDQVDETTDFLTTWVSEFNVKENAVNKLLDFLKDYFPSIPKDYRSLCYPDSSSVLLKQISSKLNNMENSFNKTVHELKSSITAVKDAYESQRKDIINLRNEVRMELSSQQNNTDIKNDYEIVMEDDDTNNEDQKCSNSYTLSKEEIKFQKEIRDALNSSKLSTLKRKFTESEAESIMKDNDVIRLEKELRTAEAFHYIHDFKINLPCVTTEQVINLNDKLQNQPELLIELKYRLMYITASNVERYVRESLKFLMTDEAAIKLSWAGQRQNYRIKSFKMIHLIKDIAKAKFNITSSKEQIIIESVIKKWFLYAGQRYRMLHSRTKTIGDDRNVS